MLPISVLVYCLANASRAGFSLRASPPPSVRSESQLQKLAATPLPVRYLRYLQRPRASDPQRRRRVKNLCFTTCRGSGTSCRGALAAVPSCCRGPAAALIAAGGADSGTSATDVGADGRQARHPAQVGRPAPHQRQRHQIWLVYACTRCILLPGPGGRGSDHGRTQTRSNLLSFYIEIDWFLSPYSHISTQSFAADMPYNPNTSTTTASRSSSAQNNQISLSHQVKLDPTRDSGANSNSEDKCCWCARSPPRPAVSVRVHKVAR